MKRARAIVDELHDPKKVAALKRVLARARKQDKPRASVFVEPGPGLDAGVTVPAGVDPERWARLLKVDADMLGAKRARLAFRARFGRDPGAATSAAGLRTRETLREVERVLASPPSSGDERQPIRDVANGSLDGGQGVDDLLRLLPDGSREVVHDVLREVARDVAERFDRLLGKLVRHVSSPVPPVGSGAANAVACSSRRSKGSPESTRRRARKGIS